VRAFLFCPIKLIIGFWGGWSNTGKCFAMSGLASQGLTREIAGVFEGVGGGLEWIYFAGGSDLGMAGCGCLRSETCGAR